MKQTAVEWLVHQLITQNEVALKGENYKLFELAKAMEKDQIIKAAIVSHFEGVRQSAKTSKEYLEYGEQYFNKTFKSE